MADERTATRIGFLTDGDTPAELMTALYEFDDLGVRVRVPYLAHDDTRGRWWSPSVMFMDDPGRTKHSYSPPSELDYFDSEGSIGLIKCSSGAGKQRFGSTAPAVGVGDISARYAVEGAVAAANYVKPNGLRSEIDGLVHWLGLSALRTVLTFAKDEATGTTTGMGKATTSTEQVEDVLLARAMNLKATGYATGSGLDTPEVTYRSKVFLETFVQAGRDWDDHLALHMGVRNLLRISAWQPIRFQAHQAMSVKERVAINGDDKNRWLEARTAVTGLGESTWKTRDRHLFTYGDVGRVGVGRWLKLANDYERGISPLVRLLDLEGATIDAHVAQLGIAVEAVGYQSLIDSGVAPADANRKSVKQRVDHLLVEVSGAYAFDANFAQDFADSYNSVKHANRAVVAPATKLDHYRDGVRLLRAWVAIKLGVRASVLAGRW